MFASGKRLAGGAALAVVASGLLVLPSAPASANPTGTGLVINEVYGGGGNTGAVYTNDFIELYNPTANPISVGGLSLQYRAAGGSGAPGSSNVFALPTKTIQAGGYFLVQAAPGTTVTDKPLPVTPDAQTTGTALNLSGTGGQIFLADGTAPLDPGTGTISNPSVVDFVGWGTSTTSYEGVPVAPATRNSAPATANATSISRTSPGADTDSNSADFAAATTPSPTTSTVAAALAVTAPGNKSAFVGTAIAPIALAATGGTPPYAGDASGLPAGLSLGGATISGIPTETGTSEVTVTVTDSASPTPASDSQTFTITVDEAPELRTIAEVQGTGARSEFAPATGNNAGQTVTVQGVVTAMYRTGGYNGMYIQTEGTGGTTDATPGASDAIFVYGNPDMSRIPAGIEIGDSVEVTGAVSEFYNSTQITPAVGGVTELDTALDPVTAFESGYPDTDAEREALEGMLLAPLGDFVVSNAYSTNQYAEVGLAATIEGEGGDPDIAGPLKQPTEHVAPSDTAGIAAIKAENAARAVTLDDGASFNYLQSQANKALPVPYLTGAGGEPNPVRVGAKVTFNLPVIFEWRNDLWKLQPTSQVTTNGADFVTFEDTRTPNAAPQDVLGSDGDLKIATFNVLNYFDTTGEAYVAAGQHENPPIVTHCTFYTDRASNRIGNDQCGVKHPGETYTSSNPNDGRGPRGAATDESLARQEAKLVNTLITMDADIVGLEEMENSIKLPGESNRDEALAHLVDLLNAEDDQNTWAYVKSPGEAMTAAAVAEQDVIRGAFIYKRDVVETVGQSRILFGTDQFANAREPLAQAFKAAGAPDGDAFAVIVNHFKSKGDNKAPTPPATGDNTNDAITGVGAFNGDRKRQATRLLQFAEDFAEERELEAVFLAGDFNSYSMEEPIDILEAGGFELIDSDQAGEETYSYNGLSGSLDHVLGNAAAIDMVTGADIWEINANEAAPLVDSHYNHHVTDRWQPSVPVGTSDHNPEIVGVKVPDFTPASYEEVQVIGTNDFHGRLLPDAGNAAGAAPFATAVKELKDENPDSVFVAAGDLVGASTFESFIQDDEPTIEALNAMGLEVSAAGNHEFDRGYTDLADRIRGLADWEYIAANLEYDPEIIEEGDELAETWTKTMPNGRKIGFVGAVTEDLPALVNPTGIGGITVTDVVDATNDAAAALKSGPDPVDLVVLLVHEGSPSTVCNSDSFTDEATTWGNIVQNTSADVDAIMSGHTHLAYNCRFPVQEWVDDSSRTVKRRPVVSAGQYGTNLNRLVFRYDDATGDLVSIGQDVIATAGVGYPSNTTVQGIVDDAVDYAATKGAEPLGWMDGEYRRASYNPSGTATENRGGESTLNNQVAEVQRWATDEACIETDIAFMNPGGLRTDMPGDADAGLRKLTYRGAANVQPFANTLVNMKLTGAQIKTVLEQQWQRNAQGGVPSRPFLRLGVSQGFTYTYVETPETVSVPNSAPVNTFQGEVTGMGLDGGPIDPAATYAVTVNSFLGGGGDNFWELANGTQKVDTGKVDLEAMVEYMKQYPDAAHALPVDYSQRAVEVTFPNGAPATYAPGDSVSFAVASWAMSATGDKTDAQLKVLLDGEEIGTAVVDNTIGAQPYDKYGTADIDVELPQDVPDGTVTLMLVGPATHTEIPVEVQVEDGLERIQILATNDFHGRIQNDSGSAAAGAAVLAGAVKQLRAANPNTVFAAAGDLIGASTFESFIQNDKPTIDALNSAGLEVSAVGNHELDKGYDDLLNRVMAEYDETDNPEGGAEWQYIAANLKLKATGDPAVPATWVKTMKGVDVGFVGAVTEDLSSLVSPAGIADLEVADLVDSVNEAAEDLKDNADVDLVVMLVHEGSPSTSCASMTDPAKPWGHIVTGVSDDVDAIVSGHTHLEYNCSFAVDGWADRPVKERPVVSAGQYGANLNQLVFTVDPVTGTVQAKDQKVLKLKSCTNSTACTNYAADAATADIVATAVQAAVEPGKRVLGNIRAPFARAKFAAGGENRGGESTLGNLVAEVQRWATPAETVGAADIAFMNPGGLRTDMAGTVDGADRKVTYREAANVQPFANTLVNMDLTGAQIAKVLEQQWQRNASGAVPTGRTFLRLGVSAGFTYTYTQRDDPDNAGQKLGRVTGMWLDGVPIDPAATYSVTVNSFLAAGGDNFHELANGTGKQDTGMTDLQAMVDYMAAEGVGAGVGVDYAQRAVDVTFPADAPAAYAPGAHVVFDLKSLSMTDPGDQKDTQVAVRLGDAVIGSAEVTTSVSSSPDNSANSNDDAGTAHVDVVIPSGIAAGATTLTVVGNNTGTEVRVPITVASVTPGPDPQPVPVPSTVTAGDVSMTYGKAATVTVNVSGGGGGTVTILDGPKSLGSAPVAGGVATIGLSAGALLPGTHTLTAAYSGDARVASGSDTFAVTVAKAKSSTKVKAKPAKVKVKKTKAKLTITVTGQSGVVATGKVKVKVPGQGTKTVTLRKGKATLKLAKFTGTGKKKVKVSYQGSDLLKSSSGSVVVKVVKK